MPRTKQVRKISEKPKDSVAPYGELDFVQKAQAILLSCEKGKSKIIRDRDAQLAAFTLAMKQDRLSIPVSLGNKKIEALEQGNCTLWQSISSLSAFSMLHSMRNPKTNATGNKNSDEGYLTSESSTGTSGDKRESRSSTRSTIKIDTVKRSKRSTSVTTSGRTQTVKKTTRQSRSLTRDRLQVPVVSRSEEDCRSQSGSGLKSVPNDKFRTPQNCKTLNTFGTITPKVKPNTPHVVLRRPQQGEIALSMQGSPLMTTAVVRETEANINIPLPDGRLINIQPMKGLRPSEIPELDPEIHRQLQTLKENLDKVCMYTQKKMY